MNLVTEKTSGLVTKHYSQDGKSRKLFLWWGMKVFYMSVHCQDGEQKAINITSLGRITETITYNLKNVVIPIISIFNLPVWSVKKKRVWKIIVGKKNLCRYWYQLYLWF